MNARRQRLATGLLAILLAAATLLAGCATTRTRQGPSFGIVTFNLYHDKADWPQRRALVVDELRELKPDVIVLQEVLQHETLKNQAEDLAQALGYSAYFVSIDAADKPRRYGNAILTRHPAWDSGTNRYPVLRTDLVLK